MRITGLRTRTCERIRVVGGKKNSFRINPWTSFFMLSFKRIHFDSK